MPRSHVGGWVPNRQLCRDVACYRLSRAGAGEGPPVETGEHFSGAGPVEVAAWGGQEWEPDFPEATVERGGMLGSGRLELHGGSSV